jgi:hypothetical protein
MILSRSPAFGDGAHHPTDELLADLVGARD